MQHLFFVFIIINAKFLILVKTKAKPEYFLRVEYDSINYTFEITSVITILSLSGMPAVACGFQVDPVSMLLSGMF